MTAISEGLSGDAADTMVALAGGALRMGSNDYYVEERPERSLVVGAFRIDRAPVTNAEFARFIGDTGYRTFAEIAPDPRDYPGMPPEMARAGSLVFDPPAHAVPLDGDPLWWSFVFGARWDRPLGPGSSLDGLADHPVVHVTHSDAAAYASWAGKALPSEAEWEFAACGGNDADDFPWGAELEPGGIAQANIWCGDFPHRNLSPSDERRTSSIGRFPANGYGLYDMIGNVWEWTDDWFARAPDGEPTRCCGTSTRERAARAASIDPQSDSPNMPRKVAKGGSHLCAPSYCQRYRPAARLAMAIDTSTSHLGFRCVRR